ncbi:unnamed protein product [Nezara viridula]|uniref:Neuropeptide n=1 Tax=Nezara viridula TaxID=85310 RepID=A0A9P0HHU5_NEZVI|nr:unnamed protein product [Nezara viridula]
MWYGAVWSALLAVVAGIELRFPGEVRTRLQEVEDRRLIEPSQDAAILAQVLTERYRNNSQLPQAQDDPRGFQHTLVEMLGKS